MDGLSIRGSFKSYAARIHHTFLIALLGYWYCSYARARTRMPPHSNQYRGSGHGAGLRPAPWVTGTYGARPSAGTSGNSAGLRPAPWVTGIHSAGRPHSATGTHGSGLLVRPEPWYMRFQYKILHIYMLQIQFLHDTENSLVLTIKGRFRGNRYTT